MSIYHSSSEEVVFAVLCELLSFQDNPQTRRTVIETLRPLYDRLMNQIDRALEYSKEMETRIQKERQKEEDKEFDRQWFEREERICKT